MGIIDKAINAISGVVSKIGDYVGDAITTAISNFIGKILYYITNAFMWLVSVMQQLFDVFSGSTKVEYSGDHMYLIDVFFRNKSVTNVYWAITFLGIVFVMMFTLISILRKSFDLGDKLQNKSMGGILTATFKSIFIMLILSFALSAALNLTNLAINRIGYAFDNADSFSEPQEIHFTDEQYATMARIYRTIGNYSLNPSYNSSYNLNSCYNDIRQDLSYLEQQGVFDLVYTTKEITKSGEEAVVDTWQSALQELVYAQDPSVELSLDIRHDEVSTSLLHIMDVLKSNAKFYPLESYKNTYSVANGVSLDRVLFLSGTTSAAINNKYNQNPYLTDGLRGAFYTGDKSIYSFSDVKSAFDIGVTGISYLFIWVLAYFTLRNLLRCIFSCILRIFGMISLYIVAPLTVASMPLDDGEKFKQWILNMVVQGLGVLGVIIPMRLIILFAPIVLSPDLVLFQSVSLNFIAKVLLIVGGLEAVEGFSNIVTGILTNNSAMTAMHSHEAANRMGDMAFDWGVGKTKAAGRFAGKVASGIGTVASTAAGLASDATGLTALGQKVAGVAQSAYSGLKNFGSAIQNGWNAFAEGGGLPGLAYHAARKSPSDQAVQAATIGGLSGQGNNPAAGNLHSQTGGIGDNLHDQIGGTDGQLGSVGSIGGTDGQLGSVGSIGGNLGDQTGGITGSNPINQSNSSSHLGKSDFTPNIGNNTNVLKSPPPPRSSMGGKDKKS
ncbi:MAG: hypothetical protein KBS74_01780 [Clostridiales bacterium]|nr:hypothetical protein [Candidatus Cacconaster stercorequi]